MCLDKEGRSYLENAFLSRDEEVIMMALDLDVRAYDSGAVCAEVLFLTESHQRTPSPLLMELLRRRSLDLGSVHVNLALENHAVSIAAWHACPNIITALLTYPPPTMTQSLATLAYPRTQSSHHFLLGPERLSAEYHRMRFAGSPFTGSDNWHMLPSPSVSPLLFTVERNTDGRMTEFLLEAGYKADGFTLCATIDRELPFGLIERILESCEDVDARCAVDVDWDYWRNDTPLHIAVRRGRVDIVKALLARHVDINAIRGTNRDTALATAILYDRLDIANILLNAGAEVNDPGRSAAKPLQSTVLQLASEKGHVGLVQRLIARGADLNARRGQGSGRTALEAAAENGRLDTVYLLLAAGTDTEGYGRVQYLHAIGLASEHGHGAVVELLRGHREWTGEDFTLWNQLCPRTERMADFSHRPCVHPLELPLGELVEQLAKFDESEYDEDLVEGGFVYKEIHNRYSAAPSPCDLRIARLVMERVAEIVNASCDTRTALIEEATRIAIQAIRQWSEESKTPLSCSSIWNAEHGAARRALEACDMCGFDVWYYLPCSLEYHLDDVVEMVTRSLRQWPPPFDTVAHPGATQEKPVYWFGEQDDDTMECDIIEDGLLDSHNTQTAKNHDGISAADAGDDWDEQWAIILAEMTEDQDLSFAPMDYGW